MTATWSAPGRINLIGEHVDYNDGLVLPFALPFVTTATVSQRPGQEVAATSRGVGDVAFPVATDQGEVEGWGAYVAGVVWAMGRRGLGVPGLSVAVTSDVPTGAGLSSSAALSCSVASAINDECRFGLSARDVAEVSREAENQYVGVPTGTMDQLASMLCVAEHAMLLDCRSLDTRSIRFAPAASGLVLLVIDTLASHTLVGSEYADRRRDCEAAVSALGVRSLRDVTLEQVAGLEDDRLRRRAHHVVSEITRVEDVVSVLDADRTADIGAFLTASHESLRDDFEVSCEELDVTVEVAVGAGALGARMVGGGFGGCVIALCREAEAETVTTRVRTAYDAHGWSEPTVWTPQPSPGAHRVD